MASANAANLLAELDMYEAQLKVRHI